MPPEHLLEYIQYVFQLQTGSENVVILFSFKMIMLVRVIAEIYVFCFIKFVSDMAGDQFTELQLSSHHTHE